MSDFDTICREGERVSREEGYKVLLAEIASLHAIIESLRREVREQRREIAGLREERRAWLEADRPQVDEVRSLNETA